MGVCGVWFCRYEGRRGLPTLYLPAGRKTRWQALRVAWRGLLTAATWFRTTRDRHTLPLHLPSADSVYLRNGDADCCVHLLTFSFADLGNAHAFLLCFPIPLPLLHAKVWYRQTVNTWFDSASAILSVSAVFARPLILPRSLFCGVALTRGTVGQRRWTCEERWNSVRWRRRLRTLDIVGRTVVQDETLARRAGRTG